MQPRRPRAVLAVSPPRCESPEPNGYASAALRFVGDKGFRLAWRGCFLRGSLGCSSGAFRFRGRTWMTNPWDCCGDPFEARVLHFSVLRSGGTRIVHIGANMCTLARTCARGPKGIHSSLWLGQGPPTNDSGDTNDDAIMRRAKRKARVFGRRKTHADNS